MKIALITDTHLAAIAPAFRANCDAARDWIGTIAADMTIHLGDITVDGSKYPEQLDYARDAFAGWPTPIRFIPGNHDIGDNIDPHAPHGAHEPQIDARRLGLYRAAFGTDRWSFQSDGWTVVGLNAQLFGAGDAEEAAQLAWLDDILAGVTGPLGLMLHKPLFRNGPSDTERHHRYLPVEQRLDLAGRLDAKDLRFVVCGHTHQLRRIVVAGVEHVWAPSTAFIIPNGMQETIGEKIVGALTLTLDADGHRFDYVEPAGMARNDISKFIELYPQLG